MSDLTGVKFLVAEGDIDRASGGTGVKEFSIIIPLEGANAPNIVPKYWLVDSHNPTAEDGRTLEVGVSTVEVNGVDYIRVFVPDVVGTYENLNRVWYPTAARGEQGLQGVAGGVPAYTWNSNVKKGRQVLGNGLVLQWGELSLSGRTSSLPVGDAGVLGAVTFLQPFSNAVLFSSSSPSSSSSSSFFAVNLNTAISSLATTGFVMYMLNSSETIIQANNFAGLKVSWLVIGY